MQESRSRSPVVPEEDEIFLVPQEGDVVFIEQGDGGESTSYYTSTIEKIFPADHDEPAAVLLKERYEGIPVHPRITTMMVLKRAGS